jgi:hypothetical protein
MMLVLNIHYSRASDIAVPDHVTTIPSVPLLPYRDGFGTGAHVSSPLRGQIRIASTAVVKDEFYHSFRFSHGRDWFLTAGGGAATR